ncbi:hypothetical protein Pfo_028142 [Paulownia fortunei]|nr:hypothetical protein Pfo_028142 [Paulownia fortunei]
MCPLRFILVFFSAVLAGYFAWKTVSSSDEADFAIPEDSTQERSSRIEKEEFHFLKVQGNRIVMLQNGFWVFVDMASGRYLWRKIKQLNSSQEAKTS